MKMKSLLKSVYGAAFDKELNEHHCNLFKIRPDSTYLAKKNKDLRRLKNDGEDIISIIK